MRATSVIPALPTFQCLLQLLVFTPGGEIHMRVCSPPQVNGRTAVVWCFHRDLHHTSLPLLVLLVFTPGGELHIYVHSPFAGGRTHVGAIVLCFRLDLMLLPLLVLLVFTPGGEHRTCVGG